ncbi:hypothetical protein GGI12_001779 [Dipsacomyces acuminosporus]|nr:hypothetical protein GGI12_001779 [Dipsacomyces acuminosporus]
MIDRAGVCQAIRRKYGVSLQPAWLDQCIAHIDKELQNGQHGNGDGGQRMHLEAQIHLVSEQLLHSEISESCYPALQCDKQSGKVAALPGFPGAFLQIQEIMDIGVSKFAMWEAVREKEDFEQRGIRPSYLPHIEEEENEASNVFTASTTQQNQQQQQQQQRSADTNAPGERVPKIPHSMLKLTLTDGNATISALELVPIPQLNVELPIGTKVLVASGLLLEPTGLLSLNPNGVQVLGGAPEQYADFTLKARLTKLLEMDSQ